MMKSIVPMLRFEFPECTLHGSIMMLYFKAWIPIWVYDDRRIINWSDTESAAGNNFTKEYSYLVSMIIYYQFFNDEYLIGIALAPNERKSIM